MITKISWGALVCSVWLLSAGQAPAADWSTPDPLVPDIQSTGYTLGMSGGGEAIAAWSDGGGIYAARAPRGGQFGRAQLLARTDNANSGRMLVVDGRGDAIAFWIALKGGLFASYRPAGRSFGKAVRIAGHVSYADAAIDSRGDATFAWLARGRRATTLHVRQRPARGKLRANVALDHGTRLGTPSIAVNGPGEAIVAWGSGAGKREVIRYAVGVRGHRFGRAQRLVQARHGSANPALGLDNHGRALMAWDAGAMKVSGTYQYREVDALTLKLSRRRAGGNRPVATALLRFPPSRAQTLWSDGPEVSVNGRGDQLLVFEVNIYTYAPSGTEVTGNGPGLPLPPPRIVATGNPDQVPASAVGPRGTSIIAWDDASGLVPDMAIVAPRVDRPFGAPHPISSPADDSGAPAVASDGQGDVAALWQDLGPSAGLDSAFTPSPLEFAALGR